jgi:signal transduction histidine kinase
LEGFAQAVFDDDGERLSPGSRDALERIRKAAQRMDALTTDLVDYTRLERAALPPGTVSLAAVVEESILSHKKSIDQRRAQLAVEQPLPPVRGHEKTLTVVVGHLLSNALKFVREGVRPEVRIWAEPEGEVVRLLVQDNGIGIAPDYHERIFRVFERLHGMEDYAGTGIGLAVVRKAVQRMGGRVGVRSAPGQGSCFWIELPAGGAA